MGKKRRKVFLKWKEYWNESNDPGPPIDTESWHQQNVEEILYFIKDGKTVVDTGCGNGAVLVSISDKFEKIIGLDYSKTMIEAAKEQIENMGINNIELHHIDLEEIDKVVQSPVDIIYNSQVVQFLDMEKLKHFLKKSLSLIDKEGKIALLNILDKKAIDLYSISYFKNNTSFNLYQLAMKFVSYKFWAFRKGLFNDLSLSKYSIGYWYTKDQLSALAQELDCKISFYNSMCDEFGYRFHAILKK